MNWGSLPVCFLLFIFFLFSSLSANRLYIDGGAGLDGNYSGFLVRHQSDDTTDTPCVFGTQHDATRWDMRCFERRWWLRSVLLMRGWVVCVVVVVVVVVCWDRRGVVAVLWLCVSSLEAKPGREELGGCWSFYIVRTVAMNSEAQESDRSV
jgi:hypothetical protein